jgi:hypothetical protein
VAMGPTYGLVLLSLIYIRRLTFSYEVYYGYKLYIKVVELNTIYNFVFIKQGHPHFHYHSNGNTTAKDMEVPEHKV